MAETGFSRSSPQAEYARQGDRAESQVRSAGSYSHWRPQADVGGGRLSGGPPAPRPSAPHALREGPTACRNSSRTSSTPFSSAAPWPTTSFAFAAPTAGTTSWSPSASIEEGSAHHAERAGCRRPRRINSRLSAVAPERLQLKHEWGWWSTWRALHPRTLIFAPGQRAPGVSWRQALVPLTGYCFSWMNFNPDSIDARSGRENGAFEMSTT